MHLDGLTRALSTTQQRIASEMESFVREHQRRLTEHRQCVRDHLERQSEEVHLLVRDATDRRHSYLTGAAGDPVEWSSDGDEAPHWGSVYLHKDRAASDVETLPQNMLVPETDRHRRRGKKPTAGLHFKNRHSVIPEPWVDEVTDSDSEHSTPQNPQQEKKRRGTKYVANTITAEPMPEEVGMLESTAEERKRRVTQHFESALRMVHEPLGRQAARTGVSHVSALSSKQNFDRHRSTSMNSQEEAFDRLRHAYAAATNMMDDTHRSVPSTFDSIVNYSLERGTTMRMEMASVSLFGAVSHRAEGIVENKYFVCGIAVIIMLNALMIGVQTQIFIRSAIENWQEQRSSSLETPLWLFVIDIGFNVIFFLELVLRIVALEGRFCAGLDWGVQGGSLCFWGASSSLQFCTLSAGSRGKTAFGFSQGRFLSEPSARERTGDRKSVV